MVMLHNGWSVLINIEGNGVNLPYKIKVLSFTTPMAFEANNDSFVLKITTNTA